MSLIASTGEADVDIQKMQAAMLAKGIRVADDDPIFAVASIAELAVDEANQRHRENMSSTLEVVHSFRKEMRLLADTVVNATKMLEIGRQFLSGENELVAEDMDSVKASMVRIAEQMSESIRNEKTRHQNLVIEINKVFKVISDQLEVRRYRVKSQHETFIEDQVKNISASVKELETIKANLQSVVDSRIESAISPTVALMQQHVQALAKKDHQLLELLAANAKKRERIESWHRTMCLLAVGLGATGLIIGVFIGTYLVR